MANEQKLDIVSQNDTPATTAQEKTKLFRQMVDKGCCPISISQKAAPSFGKQTSVHFCAGE